MKSLALYEELVHQRGIVGSNNMLTLLARERRNLTAACKYWRKSRNLYADINIWQKQEQVENLMKEAGCPKA